MKKIIDNLEKKVLKKETIKKSNKIINLKKVLPYIVVAILILAITPLSIMLIKRNNQENIIIKEIEIINNLDINGNIDMNIKSKNDYIKVETAVKEYYQELFNNKRIFNNNRAESLFNILTPDYLSKNKSKLKSLKLSKMIKDKTNELEVAVNNIIDMLDSDRIMSYIKKYNLDDYYCDFYRDKMVSENDSSYQVEWTELLNINTKKIEYLDRVVDILVDNTSEWYIENNNLYFTDDKLLREYNELHNLIYENDDENNLNSIAL